MASWGTVNLLSLDMGRSPGKLTVALRQLFPRAFPHTLAQWFDCSPRRYDIILYWGTSWQGENKRIAHLTSKDDSGNARKLTIKLKSLKCAAQTLYLQKVKYSLLYNIFEHVGNRPWQFKISRSNNKRVSEVFQGIELLTHNKHAFNISRSRTIDSLF